MIIEEERFYNLFLIQMIEEKTRIAPGSLIDPDPANNSIDETRSQADPVTVRVDVTTIADVAAAPSNRPPIGDRRPHRTKTAGTGPKWVERT